MRANELVVEILTEELPALPFLKEWENLSPKWEQAKARFLLHTTTPCEIHFTPRRIAIYSRDFPAHTDSITQELFGPPLAIAFNEGKAHLGLSQAGLGFCKKAHIDAKELDTILRALEQDSSKDSSDEALSKALESMNLHIAQKDGKSVLQKRLHIHGTPSECVLGAIVGAFVRSLQFGKSMRWGSVQESFIRPISNIMILFNGKRIIAQDEALESNALCNELSHTHTGIFGQHSLAATLLHRSYNAPSSTQSNAHTQAESMLDSSVAKRGWIPITSLESYLNTLEKGGVILDEKRREECIRKQIKHIESQHGVQVELDSALLAQIVAITEYPTALLGRFDERFLALPEEVIITSMKEHQRYFGVYKNGALYNGFIVVANALCDEFSAIISGNERVLKARLSDAEFFYRNDKATPLNPEPLAQIAFVDGLGSMLDKTHREKRIGAYFADMFGLDSELITQAIWYSKADLLSEMVGEFPELEGIMGYYYAKEQGLSPHIAQAIKEQYLPNGEDSALPSTKESAIVALSTKLDSLLALFSIGKIPSGSKDPYALRRAANGVVKITLEFELEYHLANTLAALAKYYTINAERLELVRECIIERIEAILGLSPLIFRSVSKGLNTSICAIAHNAKALESLLLRDDKEAVVAVFKRVANITKDITASDLNPALESSTSTTKAQAPQKHTQLVSELLDSIDTSLLTPIERTLYDKLCEFRTQVAHKGANERLDALFSLRGVLEEFFDNVLVNDENRALRANRKTLLYAIYAEFCTIGDLKELAI